MTGTKMTQNAIAKLPERLAIPCRNAVALCNGRVNEIRLRKESPMSLTVGTENVILPVSASEEEIAFVVRSF